ncbi:T9SS type A sorting domain-containing protein [Taibaiella sp. KBW10]|uniref:T9SS type A sorting domain-containing protein n=1 Tax=Taibaiella sp. KBW10 TaxID=2153357 RepID=UPI0013157018|nr:T9SS type A sorting domain-containing protein [Taibaiella sp. KBW10]
MSKKLFNALFLLGSLGTIAPSVAQNSSVMPEYMLPTVAGPVMRPQNASSSTMQKIVGASGATENLYIHSWDVYSSADYNGIAWRRTDDNGNLINEDFINVKYATDIDAVIYEDGGAYYVLAAYYYNDGDPNTKGHYYDIYKFDASGLLPASTMNPLSSSATFGRINVDATSYGLAITWCVPGVGIYTKVASLSGAAFGPDVLMPGTATMLDPDVCIRRGGGGSGTGLDLQIVFLENTLTVVREYRAPFFNVLAGSSAGFTEEYVAFSPGPKYFPPRIDCPDKWAGGQRWAVAMAANSVSGTNITEWVYAVVKNEDWPGVYPSWTSPTTVNVSYVNYTSPMWPEPCDPVIAYNTDVDKVTVGWMSQQNTSVIPGTNDKKYLAMDVKDDGTAAPAPIPGSYNMISNVPGGNEAVLAFSGQNENSYFDGLYIAFAHFHPSFPNYSMYYKSRPWSLSTFKGIVDLPTDKNKGMQFTISPNPFEHTLSFQAPAKGNYTISLMGIGGSVVYEQKCILNEAQTYQFNTPEIASGTYVMKVSSPENNIDYTQKLVKK